MPVDTYEPGYRPSWWPTGDDGSSPLGVLEIALDLHMQTVGSCDCMTDAEVDEAVRCLEWVRDHWKKPTSMFDRAVLLLIVRALNERKSTPTGAPDLID